MMPKGERAQFFGVVLLVLMLHLGLAGVIDGEERVFLPSPSQGERHAVAVRWMSLSPPSLVLPTTSGGSSQGEEAADVHDKPVTAVPKQVKGPKASSVGHETSSVAPTSSVAAVETAFTHAAAAGDAERPRFDIPPSMRLVYAVSGRRKGEVWSGTQAVFSWEASQDQYSIRWEFPHPTGQQRIQTSVGSISPDWGLLPRRFGDRLKTEQAVHFERLAEVPVIRFSVNAPNAPLAVGTQDRVSVFVQLAAMMAGHQKSEPIQEGRHRFSLPVVGGRDVGLWSFEITPVSDGEGLVRLMKHPLHPYDATWELWLAPSLGFFPIKWRVTLHNQDFVEYEWRSERESTSE
jgi:hypothetical protein